MGTPKEKLFFWCDFMYDNIKKSSIAIPVKLTFLYIPITKNLHFNFIQYNLLSLQVNWRCIISAWFFLNLEITECVDQLLTDASLTKQNTLSNGHITAE